MFVRIKEALIALLAVGGILCLVLDQGALKAGLGDIVHSVERAVRPQDLPIPRFRVSESYTYITDPIDARPPADNIGYYKMAFVNKAQHSVKLHINTYFNGRWTGWTEYHVNAQKQGWLRGPNKGPLYATNYKYWVESDDRRLYWGDRNHDRAYNVGQSYFHDQGQVKTWNISIRE